MSTGKSNGQPALVCPKCGAQLLISVGEDGFYLCGYGTVAGEPYVECATPEGELFSDGEPVPVVRPTLVSEVHTLGCVVRVLSQADHEGCACDCHKAGGGHERD